METEYTPEDLVQATREMARAWPNHWQLDDNGVNVREAAQHTDPRCRAGLTTEFQMASQRHLIIATVVRLLFVVCSLVAPSLIVGCR